MSLVGQDGAVEESNDFLIVDDEIRVDAGAGMTVYGNFTAESNATITNNGEFSFTADEHNQEIFEIFNNASEDLFAGIGTYSFKGKRNQFLSGNYNTKFYNLSMEKGISSSLVSEVAEIQILNRLTLGQGYLDVQNNLVRVENPDTNAIVTSFKNIWSFVEGRLMRRVQNNSEYHFPIASSRKLHNIQIVNRFPELNYMDVEFLEGQNIDLSATFGFQYGIAYFERLDKTGAWKINGDVKNPQGSMDIAAKFSNFNEYDYYEDNMFGLMHSTEITTNEQDWSIIGDLEYYGSPGRMMSSKPDVSILTNTNELGYYAMGIAKEQKFVNLIAPGGGRETRFIIQGLDTQNPALSQYDNESCEVVVYNIFGTEVWRKKPYANDLDLKDFKDGTYYYTFTFTIKGRPGSHQSYIDVKRMD